MRTVARFFALIDVLACDTIGHQLIPITTIAFVAMRRDITFLTALVVSACLLLIAMTSFVITASAVFDTVAYLLVLDAFTGRTLEHAICMKTSHVCVISCIKRVIVNTNNKTAEFN